MPPGRRERREKKKRDSIIRNRVPDQLFADMFY